MINLTKKPLASLALVSTVFMVAPYAYGAVTVDTAVAVPPSYNTNVTGDITITNTGSLSGTGTGILVNTAGINIIIDPDNINPAAINTTGNAIVIDGDGDSADVTVGQNSAVQGNIGINVVQGNLNLSNSGTITGVDTAVNIDGDAGFFGNIINTSIGIIQSTGIGKALNLAGDGTSVDNSGIIKTANGDAISTDVSTDITNGIVNSGTITAGGAGSNAVNLGATSNNIIFTNNATGIVNGDVIVTSNSVAGTVLINEGTINGTVIGLASAAPRVFEVNGGNITGGINISAATQDDTITQSGGTIGNIVGNPLVAGQALNIVGPVTTGGTITDIRNVVVQAPFIINHDITGVSQFLVSAAPGAQATNNSFISTVNANLLGGTFVANPTGTMVVSGILNNNGTLILKAPPVSSIVNVTTNTYLQSSSAILETQIKDAAAFGNMNITGPGVTNIAGDALKVDITGTGLIRNMDTFRIIHNTGAGTFAGSFVLLQSASSTIKFIDVSTPQDIILEALRTPFSDLTTSDITTGPAEVIDEILASGVPLSFDFQNFVIALDGLSPSGINTALATAVPQFDGGLVQLTHSLQRNIFHGIGQYIDEHRPLAALIPCYTAGDVGMGRENGFVYSRGNWGKAFASRATQQAEQISDGYDLDNVGFILGYDQYCSDRVLLGAALSYATGEVRSKATSASRQEVTSFQVTGYSTFDYKGPGYLDVMGAVSFNEYNSTRNIQAGSFFATALGQFNSWQYGVNLESGYRFSYGKYRIIPVGRLWYSYLQIDNYTETGAGGLNLSVVNKQIQEGVTGIGIKFNSTNYYQEAAYVPEFRFNIFYDWIADGQVMTSNFLEGGSSFITNGIRPNPCTYNVGLSFTALAQSGLVLVLNYDVDINQGYVDNSVSMKVRYEW